MLDINGFTLGACIFFASIGFLLKKQSKSIVVEGLKPTHFTKLRRTALVDLKLPFKNNIALQQIKNDEIISKCVTDAHNNYFICVRADEPVPNAIVFDYISSVYSKVWNEAVMKNCLDMECCVISDAVDVGMVTRKQVLLLPELKTVFTPFEHVLADINRGRSVLGFDSVATVDTNSFTRSLEENYGKYSNIYFFDAHCSTLDQQKGNIPLFKHVALGGTFDRIHNGHRKLLTLAAASCTEKLTVGIMTECMLSKKAAAAFIGKYPERSGNVLQFLQTMKPSLPVNIVPLTDPFGPTITDPNIDAIIVSSETISGAFKINDIRKEKGMPELAILVTYRADPAVLSSTFIRERNHRE